MIVHLLNLRGFDTIVCGFNHIGYWAVAWHSESAADEGAGGNDESESVDEEGNSGFRKDSKEG